jgi:hypothetical protein
MTAVRIVLVMLGIVCILSTAPGAVAPWPSIVHWLGVLGLEPMPDHPLVVYCVRLSSLGFALIGVFFLVVATNPVRYGPMVALAVCGLFLTAALAVATGIQTRMQPPWYLADAGVASLAAVLLLAFWPRRRHRI